jgi:hypothetical protein
LDRCFFLPCLHLPKQTFAIRPEAGELVAKFLHVLDALAFCLALRTPAPRLGLRLALGYRGLIWREPIVIANDTTAKRGGCLVQALAFGQFEVLLYRGVRLSFILATLSVAPSRSAEHLGRRFCFYAFARSEFACRPFPFVIRVARASLWTKRARRKFVVGRLRKGITRDKPCVGHIVATDLPFFSVGSNLL